MSENKRNLEVNVDLAKERLKCNFSIKEVTNIFDGGEEKTIERKKIEDIALNNGGWRDDIPEECMAPKEKYENAIRKSCIYSNIVKDKIITLDGIESLGLNSPALRRTADAFFKDMSPFLLHMGMFVPTIMGQCTPEQQMRWLPKALNLQIIGTYAQTELGHGTFIRGLETTATYDPETEEFVLHSPTLTSYKWWGGGLGKTVNHCIVVAQLYTKGECHGVHTFVVQIRDLETHMPLPGIKVGDIGPKMGFNTVDNGFLGFNEYRIPRDNMMMKNAQVLKDGTYVKVTRHGKLTYGTMVFVRVMLVSEVAFNLAKAVTIAVRYSAVRRQCERKPGDPEPQILDYITQQHKLFICIATAHALQLTSDWLWRSFSAVLAKMKTGNTDTLPEFHALSSCLKAISTSDSAAYIEQCRLACGGHGYMMSSNLPFLYSFVTATRTYEGDYTVLLLQTARKLSTCVASIRRRVDSGMSFEDAWEHSGVQLVQAAEAHCRAVICEIYYKEIVRLTASSSPNVKIVLNQLTSLYLMHWALERTGDLLRYSSVSEVDLVALQQKYEELLLLIRPNAVGLVDAFDLRDEILNSTLGSYDGQVYERLMAEALKSPLNEEPVNQSFHKYVKPLMHGKL
ncbi:hypothetical protein K1T71_002118 [Dendrolimus kikuchii]|uniref:Uncharacterized protein n=1 Tax=Dendrolimus kikuchii TaxID=765133 RepID=A0ACC1DFJ1_9NEOP|nr:hypothetical protein K1T71_002118 [Dendrolimus kikuchii]